MVEPVNPTDLVPFESVPEVVSDCVTEARYTDQDVELLCCTVWGEAGGCAPEEQALVVWCILNRVDAWEQTIEQVVTAPNQFHGWIEGAPYTAEIEGVVRATLELWSSGMDAAVLPPFATSPNYLFFSGDELQQHNYFREVY